MGNRQAEATQAAQMGASMGCPGQVRSLPVLIGEARRQQGGGGKGGKTPRQGARPRGSTERTTRTELLFPLGKVVV